MLFRGGALLDLKMLIVASEGAEALLDKIVSMWLFDETQGDVPLREEDNFATSRRQGKATLLVTADSSVEIYESSSFRLFLAQSLLRLLFFLLKTL